MAARLKLGERLYLVGGGWSREDRPPLCDWGGGKFLRFGWIVKGVEVDIADEEGGN